MAQHPRWHQLTKRFLDVIGGLIGTLITLILYPFIGLAIKLDTPGPILVKAKRVSADRVVEIYKFRSMVKNAEEQKASLRHLNERADGPFFKIKNDPRITRVGKIIRKFRLDEFPQFFNVVTGDISLVGPRPYSPEEISAYPSQYRHLSQLKAGITGLSQVSGSSALSFTKTLELDEYYNQHQTVWMDLYVMGKTLAIILTDPTAV